MTPEEQAAQLRQEVADLKAERTRLKAALDERESENKGFRDEIKALKVDKATLEGKLPAADTVVLSKDDAAAWAAYSELGKPDLIKVKLDDYDRAIAQSHELARNQLIDRAARDPSDETRYLFKPRVLERLLTPDVELSLDDKSTPHVKVGGASKTLEAWLQEDQKDFLDAVRATPNGTPFLVQPGARVGGAGQATPEQIAARKRASGEYNL